MRKKTSNPNRSYVRTQVPYQAHDKAKQVARALGLTVAYTYTLILTRELFNCFPEVYANNLAADLSYPEEEEENAEGHQSAGE